jgi:hypothetical protein
VEQRAFRLRRGDGWTYLGGNDGPKALECVVRSFESPVRVTVGEGPDDLPAATAGELVPPGQGRRFEGHHFFARPEARAHALPGAADAAGRPDALISVRGLPEA